MKSDMDNKEWLNEYPSLKQVNEKSPFTVPEGYFGELEKNVILAVKLEELKTGKGFTVPQNYFDNLSNNIQSRINIEAFVNNPEHGHTVPDGYFNELSNNIQSRVNIEAFVNNTEHGHTVPENYFDELEQQVNARIVIEETLNEQESFSVPAGYFDKLNQAILDKTVNEDNVVSIKPDNIKTINRDTVQRKGIVRKMFTPATFKYAAAACLALVIGTGLFLRQGNVVPVSSHDNSFLHEQLSTVSTDDIQSYLQDDVDANETQHTVIDEDAPVNTTDLSNALQKDAATSN